MAGLIGQREFFVDSIVLTASASPEGRYARNSTLAQGRAHALKGYLRKCIGPQVDTLMQPVSAATRTYSTAPKY